MARITINITAESEATDQDLVTLDVPLSLTVADFKSVVEAETSFPPAFQSIYHNGKAIQNDAQDLQAAGISDGDMLAIVISNPNRQRAGPSAAASSARLPPQPDAQRIELLRQQIRNDPDQMAALRAKNPALASTVDDPRRFLAAWQESMDKLEREKAEREREIRLLNQDPFNSDAQRKIQDIIRREKIQENLQYALENNPAVFAQVTMLYVPVTVNGRPVKAFVDSGAQTTIMSPDCAETCGISYLIDERYAGIAKGVGTARILGRVHHAKIQVGDAELDCAFTVMEGKDVDLLFGLDMLKRHQACIDLKRGKLTLPHTEVDFLPESEIPRRDDSAFADAPLEPGPSAVAPARPPAASSSSSSSAAPGPLAAAAVPSSLTPVPSSLTPVGQRQVPPPTAGAGSPHPQGQAQQARARPPRPQGQPPPAAAAAAFPEESVRMLMGMGASRVEAVQALEAAGGNVELAAGILFN